MEIPDFDCRIEAFCSVNPSEDPEKVKKAISNVLSDMEIHSSNNSLKATSENLETLLHIFDVIHSRKTHQVYRRSLKKNCSNDSTWFYLNKQAASANVVVLCEEAEESPLGPIKIILTSDRIEDVIDWLVSLEQ